MLRARGKPALVELLVVGFENHVEPEVDPVDNQLHVARARGRYSGRTCDAVSRHLAQHRRVLHHRVECDLFQAIKALSVVCVTEVELDLDARLLVLDNRTAVDVTSSDRTS